MTSIDKGCPLLDLGGTEELSRGRSFTKDCNEQHHRLDSTVIAFLSP